MKYNDSILKPPGPVIDVAVRPAGQRAPVRTRPGELDTGAAISIIPQELTTQLRLTPDGQVLMLGYDENETKRWTYIVDLEIAGFALEAIKVVAVPRDTILLGRDVLRHFIITLDGKAQTFEMVDP